GAGGGMGLADRLWRRRADPSLTIGGWLQLVQYAGVTYGAWPQQSLGGKQDEIADSFAGYIQGIYKSNGIVYACMAARMLLFSEARFQFRRMVNGRPGELYGTQELGILERPWANATTW